MRHRITPHSHKTSPANPASPASPRDSARLTTDRTIAITPAREVYPDPEQVAAVLRDLAAVPATELPAGPAREALIEAITAGAVDGVYRPFGSDYHTLTLAWLAPAREPRRRIAEWQFVWRLVEQWNTAGPVTWFLDGWQPGASPDEALVARGYEGVW